MGVYDGPIGLANAPFRGLYDGKPGRDFRRPRRSLEISPDFARAHFNLGVAFFQKGETDKAVAQFQKTLEIDPNDAGAHNNLGAILLQTGKIDEAVSEFLTALRLSPHDRDAQTNLVKAQYMARQHASQR